MVSRQLTGIFASLLAVGLMACTSPLAPSNTDGDKDPNGQASVPGFGEPSPFIELGAPGQVDEAVEDPVVIPNWNLLGTDSVASPPDQQIKRIHGARRLDGGYRFFLQQGDTFYHRTVEPGVEAPAWSNGSKFPHHRNYHPTKVFSDGEMLFFVNDANETVFSGTETILQASSTDLDWSKPLVLPAGIVAVTGGPGLAFAATEKQLFMWNGSSWNEIVNLMSGSERFVGLSLDQDLPGNELIVLLRGPLQGTYFLKKLSGNHPGASLMDAQMNFDMPADHPVKVFRSFPYGTLSDSYYYWGHSQNNYIYYGSTSGTMKRFVPSQVAMVKPFERTFRGLDKLMGRFYAFRSDPNNGLEIFHLKDDLAHNWQVLSDKRKLGGGRLWVTLADEQSLAVDGKDLFAAGAEGLFRYPLSNGEPLTYQQNVAGWEQEPVKLNRAAVTRILRVGSTNYARTAFGTYHQSGGAWIPFERDLQPAMVFTSHYGQAATTVMDNTVRLYLYLNGDWRLIDKPWPTGTQPQAAKLFFAKDRIFMAAKLSTGGEVILSRFLDTGSEWRQALPALSSAPSYYMSDGKTVFAVDATRVKLASLTDKVWKDYANKQVLEDGSTAAILGAQFDLPFAVYGYSFAWVKIGPEYKLCRATANGWKPIVSEQVPGGKVNHQLSTDGHYLYGWVEAPTTRYAQAIVRVPIKGGKAWETKTVQVDDGTGSRPLAMASLTVNGPVVIDRAQAKVYLPTSLGIVGHP